MNGWSAAAESMGGAYENSRMRGTSLRHDETMDVCSEDLARLAIWWLADRWLTTHLLTGYLALFIASSCQSNTTDHLTTDWLSRIVNCQLSVKHV